MNLLHRNMVTVKISTTMEKAFTLLKTWNSPKNGQFVRPTETNGWVHKYELDISDLKILDFQKYDVFSWLAELMKHRDAADTKRYKVLSKKFIEKFGIDTSTYDVIKGWRANASYFYIAKEFVRDNVDTDILEELLSLGGSASNIVLNPNLLIPNSRRIKKA